MGENLVINRTVVAVQLKRPAWWSNYSRRGDSCSGVYPCWKKSLSRNNNIDASSSSRIRTTTWMIQLDIW